METEMSADQVLAETVSELDEVVFDTEVPDDGETVVGIVEAATEQSVKAAFQAIAGKTAEVATEEIVEPAVEAPAEEAVTGTTKDTEDEVVEATAEEPVETPLEEITEPAVEATESVAEEAIEATDSADDDTSKKVGLLGMLKSPIGIAAVAVLVLALGGGGFFLATSGGESKESEQVESAEAEPGYDEAKTDQKADAATYAAADPGMASENTFENEYGSISFSGEDAIYHTAPATVSLDIGADARRLRVSVGVLTDQETAKALFSDGLKVSVLQIEAVESVDFGPYREWEMPGLIVSAFKTKLEEAYPDKQIRAVMIRDFQRVGT